MLSRRAILIISFLVALVIHGLIILVAPRVSMLQVFDMRNDALSTFRVELKNVPPPSPQKSPEFVVASRPGQVTDLLRREEEILSPDALAGQDSLDPASLAERLKQEPQQQDYARERDESILQRVDAKILEIAAEDARRDLAVPRRLVRPSPERLLGDGELPSMRSPLINDAPLSFDLPARSLLAEGLAAQEAAVPPSVERPTPPPAQDRFTQPVLELMEEQVDRAPLQRAVAEARAQSAYDFMDELVDIGLESYRAGGEGFFRLSIVPKQGKDIEILPKDITFIIDASNSIPQFKLNTTTAGVARALQYLRPQDTFNIVAFRDSPEFFQPQPMSGVAENTKAAEKFLKDMKSRGQTNVYEAILPVLKAAARPGIPSVAIVLSDGRPTAGIQDARVIINGLTGDNALHRSIFAFGGGNTVNRYLLDLLAYRNKGVTKVVPDVNQIDEAFPEFFARLNDPLLVNLRAEYANINPSTVVPRVLPDFYKGQLITLYGKYAPDEAGEFVMRLSGQAQDQKKEIVFKADLRSASTGDREIARNWAFQRSYDIIGEISRVGEKPELLAELRKLAAAYNIRTTYTE